MGNAFCFTGSRHNNRILPTNSTVLAFGLRNKDIVSYRRHKKKDDCDFGSPVVSGVSKGKSQFELTPPTFDMYHF